jgi:hypothetical protein
MPTAVVEIATGRFMEFGAVADGVVYQTVTVPRNPDCRLEKWDGAAIVATTPADMAAYASAERDALIAREAGREIVKALLLFYLRDKLGRNPTGAERDAARTAFLQAYRDVS